MDSLDWAVLAIACSKGLAVLGQWSTATRNGSKVGCRCCSFFRLFHYLSMTLKDKAYRKPRVFVEIPKDASWIYNCPAVKIDPVSGNIVLDILRLGYYYWRNGGNWRRSSRHMTVPLPRRWNAAFFF